MSTHWREEDLIPYLDGRLSPVERARLEEHLAACVACRDQVEETRALLGVLEEWKAVEPSPSFDAALRARLAEEKTRGKSWFVLRPAYAAALTLAVVVAVGLSLWQPGPPESGSPQRVSPQVAQSPSIPEGDEPVVDTVLLEDYELLEEFDVLFEPMSNGEKKL